MNGLRRPNSACSELGETGWRNLAAAGISLSEPWSEPRRIWAAALCGGIQICSRTTHSCPQVRLQLQSPASAQSSRRPTVGHHTSIRRRAVIVPRIISRCRWLRPSWRSCPSLLHTFQSHLARYGRRARSRRLYRDLARSLGWHDVCLWHSCSPDPCWASDCLECFPLDDCAAPVAAAQHGGAADAA